MRNTINDKRGHRKMAAPVGGRGFVLKAGYE
jgi:hypothetical protein